MSILKSFIKSLRKFFSPAKQTDQSTQTKSKKSIYYQKAVSKKKPSILVKKKTASSSKKNLSPKIKTSKSLTKKDISKKNISSKLKKDINVKGSKKDVKAEPDGVLIGEVTHFFSKIQVAVIKITKGPLKVGDEIRVEGAIQFKQKVASIQIESVNVKEAKKGQLVGLKVNKEAKVGDKVFKLT